MASNILPGDWCVIDAVCDASGLDWDDPRHAGAIVTAAATLAAHLNRLLIVLPGPAVAVAPVVAGSTLALLEFPVAARGYQHFLTNMWEA